jgi:DNA helicase-2/ATP-dependent DNA helicase PcrA
MITKFVKEKEKCKEFDVVFIDEAQDLSPIQWMMYDVLKEKSKDIYLAGDDDQAIFAWAGADVKRFLNEPAEEVVLPYSNRVPKNIQELSNVIVSRIQTRKEKQYFPKKGSPGSVEFIYNIEHIDLTKDNW